MSRADYIEREAVNDLIKAECSPKVAAYLIDAVATVPAADVRPVVSGKWIIHKPFDSGRHNCNECIECSVCGTWFGHDCYEISNFCPNCGADIREEIDHD